jgi:O-acetyl-ADP-ribose deacetylase (regulator of RNase III)
LPCRHVIHAVGPIWGEGNEDAKLTAAVTGSLQAAEDLGLGSLAMPAISTGIYGFPKARAAGIIFSAIEQYFNGKPDSGIGLVRVVLYDAPTRKAFTAAWGQK